MFQPLFLQLDGNAGFDLVPVNLNHPKLGGSIISIYYSLLLGQLWTHLGFCGFKNRILRNDKMELRPPGCPFLSPGRRQELLLDTHRSASPNICACTHLLQQCCFWDRDLKKKNIPPVQKPCFFSEKTSKKDGWWIFVPYIWGLPNFANSFSGRSEVAKPNVLVKPPNCEHVKKSESHLRCTKWLVFFMIEVQRLIEIHLRGWAYPPNATFPQSNQASLRDP